MITVIWVVSILYLCGILFIGMKVSKDSSASFDDYALAGKSLPFFLLMTKKGEFTAATAKVTPLALRYSLIFGTLTAIVARHIQPLMDIFGGPVIPSAVVTIVLLFGISSMTGKDTSNSIKA